MIFFFFNKGFYQGAGAVASCHLQREGGGGVKDKCVDVVEIHPVDANLLEIFVTKHTCMAKTSSFEAKS